MSLDEFISCVFVHISYDLLSWKSQVKAGYWWGMIGYEMTWYFEEQGDSEQGKVNRKLAVPFDYSSLCQVKIKTRWLLRWASLAPTSSEHNHYVSSPNSAPHALRFQTAGVSPSELLVPNPSFSILISVISAASCHPSCVHPKTVQIMTINGLYSLLKDRLIGSRNKIHLLVVFKKYISAQIWWFE